MARSTRTARSVAHPTSRGGDFSRRRGRVDSLHHRSSRPVRPKLGGTPDDQHPWTSMLLGATDGAAGHCLDWREPRLRTSSLCDWASTHVLAVRSVDYFVTRPHLPGPRPAIPFRHCIARSNFVDRQDEPPWPFVDPPRSRRGVHCGGGADHGVGRRVGHCLSPRWPRTVRAIGPDARDHRHFELHGAGPGAGDDPLARGRACPRFSPWMVTD